MHKLSLYKLHYAHHGYVCISGVGGDNVTYNNIYGMVTHVLMVWTKVNNDGDDYDEDVSDDDDDDDYDDIY